MYFNIEQGKAKGIFIPNLKSTQDMSNFAHEFEHYMYNEHTPKRKLALAVFRKIGELAEKLKPLQSKQSKKLFMNKLPLKRIYKISCSDILE